MSLSHENVQEGPSQIVRVRKWPHFRGDLPKYETRGASGFDVRAQLAEPVVLQPGQRVLIPTGLSFEIPLGFELQARPRSGWAIKQGISLVNSPGTIDADYRGEVKIIIINLGQDPVTVNDQDRICQMVLCPVLQCAFEAVESLSETARGEGGFGSTGTGGSTGASGARSASEESSIAPTFQEARPPARM